MPRLPRIGAAAALVTLSAALGAGCWVENPLLAASDSTHGDTSTAESASASASGTTTAAGTTSTSGPTTASGETTGAATTGELTTGTTSDTDGPDTTTGGGALTCPEGFTEELHKLAVAIENSLVVSANTDGKPCAWPNEESVEDCRNLRLYDHRDIDNDSNYGYFDMAADPERGTSYFLVRFDPSEVMSAWPGSGQVIGFRLGLVYWEPKAHADPPKTLEVRVITPADEPWKMSEATFSQRSESMAWSGGDLKASLAPGGTVLLDEVSTIEGEEDSDMDQYHSRVQSATFVVEEVKAWLSMGPALAVVHTDPLPQPFMIGHYGVKPVAAPWSDPLLYAVTCSP